MLFLIYFNFKKNSTSTGKNKWYLCLLKWEQSYLSGDCYLCPWAELEFDW